MDCTTPVPESDTGTAIFPTEIMYHILHFVNPEELIRLQIVRIVLPPEISLTNSYIAP